jgi:deoxyribodipyrimidine photolyase
MRGIVWFNDDLRTHDNPALYHAGKQCDEGIVAVYARTRRCGEITMSLPAVWILCYAA